MLVARVGIGLTYAVYHGWPKLAGGPDRWETVGGAMAVVGITFLPVVWGLLAALAETVGAALFALGLYFRPAALILLVTMLVATGAHIFLWGDGVSGATHAIKMAFVFFGFLFVGAGKYSLDRRFGTGAA